MQKHPFRTLRETGSSPQKLAELLAPDVVFASPVLAKSIVGKELVLEVMLRSVQVRDGIYTDEFRQGHKTVLIWKGTIQGQPLESFASIVDDDQGKIKECTVAMRPFASVVLFREAMLERLEGILPPDVLGAVEQPGIANLSS